MYDAHTVHTHLLYYQKVLTTETNASTLVYLQKKKQFMTMIYKRDKTKFW